MTRKLVYIAHRLAGPEHAQNRASAAKWVAWAAVNMGVSPIADWIILSGELDESYRELGLECDLAAVERCEEVWLVGGVVSPGMRKEAMFARSRGIHVYDLSWMGPLPPVVTRASLTDGIIRMPEWAP